jgi:hypothetical protein
MNATAVVSAAARNPPTGPTNVRASAYVATTIAAVRRSPSAATDVTPAPPSQVARPARSGASGP